MPTKYFSILLLYILVSAFTHSIAQNARINIEATEPITQSLRDSLNLPRYFDINQTDAVLDSIHQQLNKIGYIENQFLKLEKINDSTYLTHFSLGQKFSHIKLNYNPDDFSKKQIQSIASNISDHSFINSLTHLEQILYQLTLLKSKEGKPFAQIYLSEIEKKETNILEASIFVKENAVRYIDKIIIKGYEKFPLPYIKYYAGIRKGKIFNQKDIIRRNNRLDKLLFASSIQPPEALFRKDSTIVYLYLQKENNNVFDGILGFSTEEETQKLVFNGYLNLELNNNFNTGETFLLNYKADGKEQIEFNTELKLPFIFKTRFGLNGSLRIYKRDTSYVTTENQAQLTYRLTPGSEIFSGFSGTTSTNLLDEAIAGTPIENFKSKFFTFGITTTLPNDTPIFPIKTEAVLKLGIGKRTREIVNESQWRALGSVIHLFNLTPFNTLMIKNETAALISDSYIFNELYRFGGINSIRGFNENSIDASLYSYVNIELRHLFNQNIFIHTLTDFAYFENPIFELKNNLYSLGFGFGMNSKPGLFRFIIANGTVMGEKFEFSNSNIHLSLRSRF